MICWCHTLATALLLTIFAPQKPTADLNIQVPTVLAMLHATDTVRFPAAVPTGRVVETTQVRYSVDAQRHQEQLLTPPQPLSFTDKPLPGSEYVLSATEITNDLTDGKGRPKWLLSSWGVKDGPKGFFEDYSPEEVRWRFYELAAQGKEAEADQEAISLWNKADSEMRSLAGRVDDIGNMMRDAEKQHPNRWDFLKMDGTKTREQFISEFQGMNSSSGNTPFGANASANSSSNPFSKPATSTFGQPSQPSVFGANQSSAFGSGAFGGSSSSSPFGQPALNSAFGKPAFGGNTFGQPSQPTSSFGQPSQPTSAFGQPSQPASAFGQPSQASSAFGSTGFGAPAQKNPFAAASASSGFGQPSQPTSSFGQPSQPTSTFGQPSQPASSFGQPSQPTSTFGQPSQPTSSFGQPSQPTSTFGQPSQPTSAFGQPSQPASTFGQPSQSGSSFGQPTAFGQASSSFGQPSQPASTFGQSPQPRSSFGQPSQPSSGFGQPAFGTGATPAFGQPSAPVNSFGNQAVQQQQPNDQAMDAMSPGASRPTTRGNPFGATNITSQQTGSPPPAQSVPPPPAPKAIVNTSSTPHPLTGKPPAGVLITQSLPARPPQKNRDQLVSYRGQQVRYVEGEPCYQRPDRKGYQKIWFPDGAAATEIVALNREDKLDDIQGSIEQYTDAIKEQYKYFFENGSFQGGRIPLVPPMREWAVYDF